MGTLFVYTSSTPDFSPNPAASPRGALPTVSIAQAVQLEDRKLIASLLAAYLGEFGVAEAYPYLGLYWEEVDRFPLLIIVGDEVAGFALVRSMDGQREFELAEFYVSPTFRHRGVGRIAAQALFAQFGGTWRVRVKNANIGACAFWGRTLPPVAADQQGAHLSWRFTVQAMDNAS